MSVSSGYLHIRPRPSGAMTGQPTQVRCSMELWSSDAVTRERKMQWTTGLGQAARSSKRGNAPEQRQRSEMPWRAVRGHDVNVAAAMQSDARSPVLRAAVSADMGAADCGALCVKHSRYVSFEVSVRRS